MPEEHKSKLIARSYTQVVGVQRIEGMRGVGVVPDGVQSRDFVVVYRVLLLVLFTRYPSSDILIGESEYCKPMRL